MHANKIPIDLLTSATEGYYWSGLLSLSLEEFDKHWTSGREQAKGEITLKAALTITRIDKWAAVRSITTSFSRINLKGGGGEGSRPRKTKQE